MNVMIVEDEKLLRSGFRHMTDWSEKGIQITAEAANGKDALMQLSQMESKPDVVLTDIQMPVMNGVELTKQLKKQYPQIAVIVLSGYDQYEYVRDSMRWGASDYLLKASIDTDEIYEALQRIKINAASRMGYSSIQLSENQRTFPEIEKQQLQQYLELKQFGCLKSYLIEKLSECGDLEIGILHDILRDSFFFIEYMLDSLGFLSNYLHNRKYINSSAINLITDIPSAIDWISFLTDELESHCVQLSEKQDDLVKKVIAYIEEHYTEQISLSSIASSYFINKNYLCNLFKSETGSTIHEYLAGLRIEKAKLLIRKSDKNLTEIAESVGYQNHSYFGQVFRKKNGLSPSEYMKLYR